MRLLVKSVRSVLATAILVCIAVLMFSMVAEMPTFGEPGPAYNELTQYLLENTVTDTGAQNVISAIILDYRAYDTLGEASVLFAGIAAVLTVLLAHRSAGRGQKNG
ncbi:MAG: hypothetical protein FH749_08930 [Firmicutes bacterium]|nr:hypothetical protein [Bacillota bacterium]